MGNTVFLKANELHTKNISAARTSLEKTNAPLIEASNTMVNIIENHNGAHFMWEAAEEAGSISAEIDRIAENLEALKTICTTSPDELETADKGFRGWNNKNYATGKSGKKQSIWDVFGITWLLHTVFGIDIAHHDTPTSVSPAYDPSQSNASPVPPEKKLESIHDYDQGVERGTIRYCNQNPTYYDSNGWDESYRWSCGWHCNRASESMAFSYLGIDVTPGDMEKPPFDKYEFAAMGVNTGYTAELPTANGETASVKIAGTNGFNRSVLDQCVADYMDDNGKGSVSPVMLHYDKVVDGKYQSHWINLIGKNDDGSYLAIGPWSNTGADGERVPFNVYIDDYGVVSGEGFSGCGNGRHVSHIGQYIRLD